MDDTELEGPESFTAVIYTTDTVTITIVDDEGKPCVVHYCLHVCTDLESSAKLHNLDDIIGRFCNIRIRLADKLGLIFRCT